MDVKEAVETAKSYIAELFGPEGAENIGLEEIEPSVDNDDWIVTIGFSRPWDRPNPLFTSVSVVPRRTYKVVRINGADQKVISVRNRETEN